MVRGRLLLHLCGLLLSCSPAAPRVRAPDPPTDQTKTSSFKRVDYWRFVDPDLPVTPIELQLQRHFERAFTLARHSPELSCGAREFAAFFEQHVAAPEESLGMEIRGRCGGWTDGSWMTVDVYSDGTVLDSPLSPELLSDLTKHFRKGLPPFTAFGIAARYAGPNAIVLMTTASPRASMYTSTADEEGNVRVEGQVDDEFPYLRAVINHGELGTETCDRDPKVALPRYALDCRMAVGDDSAWIDVTGYQDVASWGHGLGEVLARRSSWVPAKEYQRVRLNLPAHGDTATALLTHINESRASLDRHALELAREQSSAMQPLQERMFRMYANGAFENQAELTAEALRGEAVRGPIWSARIVSGIAFDGDAADWLAYRFLLPGWRETLMSSRGDLLALATHGHSNVGFGATAVVYSLFTPDRELDLADAISARIAEVRGKLGTHRLEIPLEFVEAAQNVASGRSTPDEALSVALRRLNLLRREKTYLDGLVLDLPWLELDFEVPDVLLDLDDLTHGVMVTHFKSSRDHWARAVAFVWFVNARPPQIHTNGKHPERQPRMVHDSDRVSLRDGRGIDDSGKVTSAR